MTIRELQNPFDEGLRALSSGMTKLALYFFEKASEENYTPLVRSYLAYCQARTGGTYQKCVALCMDARKDDPKNSDIYLNLGKIHLLADNRKQAIQVFKVGLRQQRNSRISAELSALGMRKPPPLSFLHRTNPVNKYLGLVMTKLWLR